MQYNCLSHAKLPMEPSQPIAPIGASVVQFIASGAKNQSDGEVPVSKLPSEVRQPCLLMTGGNKDIQSLVLNGPENSGKTSIAMNLAYSCAGSLDCPCIDVAACRCTGAIVFRSATDMEPFFPPTCHRFPSTDNTRHMPTSSPQFQRKWKVPHHDDLRREILQRIRILHVDSVIQIIEELLSLREEEQKSVRCIVIDDIDKIAGRSDSGTSAILQTGRSGFFVLFDFASA